MRKALKSITAWTLWSQPWYAIAVLLSVELVAALMPWTSATHVTRAQLGQAALLASLSITYSLFTVTWERMRVLLNNGEADRKMCPNLLAAWTFPAAVLLPLPLSTAVILAGACADWRARAVPGQSGLYRYVYSTAGVVLAAAAAGRIMALDLPFGAGLVLAALAYIFVGVAVVVLAMASVGQLSAARMFLSRQTYNIELITLLIGITEVLMVTWHVPLVWLSLLAAVIIQRRLRKVAVQDRGEETVLMAERVWVHVARGVIAASETASVLRIDSNDARAASELARMQAGCDAIGYYGDGAGLAILLVDCPGSNADALAARMRSALSHGGVQARVAVAAKPRDGQRLEDLLVVTEADLVTFDSSSDASAVIPPQQ